MLNKFLKVNLNSAVRRHRKVAAYAVLGLVLGALLVFRFQYVVNLFPGTEIVAEPQVQTEEVVFLSAESSLPTKLRIPSANIEADFSEPLGVGSSYEIEVPDDYVSVGYYKHGPTPGEVGPAVVLGHVDSYEGPAVLYSLGQVEVGELIEIEREDGSIVVFVVEKLERHSQDGFPTEKVYSDLDYAGLRVITCSGTYDRGVQRYSHNLIVFAKLVEIIEGTDILIK